ncbi:MAG: hydantoinase/oxoprolinase family protein, partial [Spirochaetes bacterium]|nr:hydantoinase/oxoprolinase family protein [Spirochaetota bacterium]
MDDFDITLAGEIGGTFTDIILFEKGSRGPTLRTLKTPSTPKNPEEGLLAGFDRLSPDWEKTGEVLHGSTVGTNAVLERKGVKTAFLVTEGFRDILEIQRGDKENIYDLCYQRPSPLVPRNLVFPVKERISAKGEVLISLNHEQINEIASQLKKEGIKAAGICFLHSYLNPVNEQRAKEELQKRLPEIYILVSSEIIPQFREYERASTTVMSAYLVPIMSNYIENLGCELEKRKFAGKLFITQSNGGMLPAEAIRSEVIRTLESGPAAGVTGAINIAKQAGLDDIITLDMGGTSTDVCLVNNGKPTVNSENLLNGLPIAVPMIDICSVGAGGGSIAWLDK